MLTNNRCKTLETPRTLGLCWFQKVLTFTVLLLLLCTKHGASYSHLRLKWPPNRRQVTMMTSMLNGERIGTTG